MATIKMKRAGGTTVIRKADKDGNPEVVKRYKWRAGQEVTEEKAGDLKHIAKDMKEQPVNPVKKFPKKKKQ